MEDMDSQIAREALKNGKVISDFAIESFDEHDLERAREFDDETEITKAKNYGEFKVEQIELAKDLKLSSLAWFIKAGIEKGLIAICDKEHMTVGDANGLILQDGKIVIMRDR